VQDEHYLPAVQEAIEQARRNVEKIKANEEEPTFENTIVALETASDLLGTVASIFYNQLSAAGTDTLEALAEKIGPMNANFANDVALDETLFARVKTVYDQREDLDLNAEEKTLLEDTYRRE
jgi:peptidyl-dipeptidase Dcp